MPVPCCASQCNQKDELAAQQNATGEVHVNSESAIKQWSARDDVATPIQIGGTYQRLDAGEEPAKPPETDKDKEMDEAKLVDDPVDPKKSEDSTLPEPHAEPADAAEIALNVDGAEKQGDLREGQKETAPAEPKVHDHNSSLPGIDQTTVRLVEELAVLEAEALEIIERGKREVDPEAPPPTPMPFKVKYYWILFFGYYITTALYVIDRIWVQTFPRQDFKMIHGFTCKKLEDGGDCGDYGYGTSKDRVNGILADGGDGGEGPWSAFLFDVLARVSGRVSVAATNLCFFTMMNEFHAFTFNHAPKFLDVADIHSDMRSLHIQGGLQIIFGTLPHIFSLFIPCIFSGYDLVYEDGKFDIPGTERQSYSTVDIKNEVVTIGTDDIWRLVEMAIMLGVLLPLTYRLLYSNWRLGIKIHVVIGIMYWWDIVRRHSHPHSWIFNGSMFLFWMIDRTVSLYSRKSKIVATVIPLGHEYFAIFAKNQQHPHWLAPLTYLKSQTCEYSHPFTAAQNRVGAPYNFTHCQHIGAPSHVFPVMMKPAKFDGERPVMVLSRQYKGTEPGQQVIDYDWCWVIQTSFAKGALTNRMAQDPNGTWATYELNLIAYSAYKAPYQRAAEYIKQGCCPVMIIASGSGAGLVLDALDYITQHDVQQPVHMVYMVRDVFCFQFVTDVIHTKLASAEARSKLVGKLTIEVALTGTHDGMVEGQNLNRIPKNGASQEDTIIRARVGRLNIATEVENSLPNTHVFFCGAPMLQDIISHSITTNGCGRVLHSSHCFGGPTHDDVMADLDQALLTGLITEKEHKEEAKTVAKRVRTTPKHRQKNELVKSKTVHQLKDKVLDKHKAVKTTLAHRAGEIYQF